MGDKDQSTKTTLSNAAEPTPEQVKQFEEWLHAQNSQPPFSPFRIDPLLTTILHQQQPAQQTPRPTPQSVVFMVPAAGQKDGSGQDSKGQGGGTRLPFTSSEALAAKPSWDERLVSKFPGDWSASEAIRSGYPLAKEGLAETGEMVALPFA